jgi:cellulose synthase/poly-beta-1,6-N-acetylglucosamine synthase-like glycosyltransferase
VVRKKPLRTNKKNNFRPKVSIIITTWNEENTIEGKLKNTLSLDYPKNKLEVIVIDSGSTDRTKSIVRKFRSVKLITEKTRMGKAHALNIVFGRCKGEIVVMSDSDCRLEKDILEKAIPYFFDPKVGAVTGRQILLNSDENLATKTESKYRQFYFTIRQAESIIDSTPIFHGEFSAFRKNLLDKIYNDSVADDSELAMRIRKKNFRAIMVWDAIYKEYAPNKLSERIKQKSRRAQGLIQIMFRFFPTFFMNPRYGYFGMIIFPLEFFMHVLTPLILLTAAVSLIFLPVTTLILFGVLISFVLMFKKTRFFFLTFLHSQYACLKGMLTYAINGPSKSWDKVFGTRRYGS